jgi:hypothetical protein
MHETDIRTRYLRAGALGVILWLIALCGGAAPATRATTVDAGNQFYRVLVEDAPERPDLDAPPGVGTYVVVTGPDHPAGSGLNVLYRIPQLPTGTSYTTIRSYTSGTDYVQGRGIGGEESTVWLNPYGTVEPLGTTGFRTTYALPDAAADNLTIISDVQVSGTTFDDSVVNVTTQVRNDGTTPVEIGFRYLWDFQIALDDGPTLQALNPDGPARETETTFTRPVFESFKIEDNDKNETPPTFNVFGTVTGPATITPAPTPPDRIQFVDWESAYLTPFNYTVTPTRTVTLGEGRATNDSAALLFFGADRERSFTIPPGETTMVSAAIFATPPAPLTISLTPPSAAQELGQAQTLTATVRDNQGNPVADQAVLFTVSGANPERRSGTSDAAGEVRLTYSGTQPGSDTITTWIDRNANEQREPTEPADVARVSWEEPTAVTLVDFTATPAGERVTLRWETATEIDNAGFNLYRSSVDTGPAVRLNAALIDPADDGISGATYAFDDQPGAGTWYYWLEDIDLNGTTTLHGPVRVQVEPAPAAGDDQLFLPIIIR